ncbi:MAG: hypothetical protein ACTSPY_17065 [Candidatus Helarchaeota archaeon]
MASDKENRDLRGNVVESFNNLLDLIKEYLKKKGIDNADKLSELVLINKLNNYIDSFQVSKIQGLQIFNKHIREGFTPLQKDAERFIRQIEELTEIFDPSAEEKIKRITEIIQSVSENIIRYSYESWARKYSKYLVDTARRLQRITEYMANLGDLDGIFNYYINMLKEFNNSQIGQILDEYGKNEFKTEFQKIQKIYFMK